MSDKAVNIAQAPVESREGKGTIVPQNDKNHNCDPQTVVDAVGKAIKEDVAKSDKGPGGTVKNAAIGALDMGVSFLTGGFTAGLISGANDVRQSIPAVTGTINNMRECKGDEHGALTPPKFPVAKAEPVAKKVVAL